MFWFYYLMVSFLLPRVHLDDDAPNLTILSNAASYYKYFRCVVSNHSVNSAIAWITPNLRDATVSRYKKNNGELDCKFNINEDCTKKWTAGGWTLVNSLPYKLGPILDYRWEGFPIIVSDSKFKHQPQLNIDNYTDLEIPISVRTEKDANILLCDNTYPPYGNCYWFIIGGWDNVRSVIRKCKANEISAYSAPDPPCSDYRDERNHTVNSYVSGNKWSHFVLKAQNKTYSLRKYGELKPFLNYTDATDEPFSPKFLVIRSGVSNNVAWKFHSYYFLVNTVSESMQLGPLKRVGKDQTFCFAFFISLCDGCELKLSLLNNDDDSTIDHLIVSHEGSTWKEIKYIRKFSEDTVIKLFFYNYFVNNVVDPFWAIGDVRECSDPDFRTAELSYGGYDNPDCECQVITHPEKGINTKNFNKIENSDSSCPTDTFGRNCILCNDVLSTLCSGYLICDIEKDGLVKCSCPAGYGGSGCDKCSSGSYGFGCHETCGNCDNSVCDHVSGYCSPCTEIYTGDTCKILKYPMLKNLPEIVVSHSSITIQLNTDYEGLEPPTKYIIQLQENYAGWQSVGEYNFDDTSPKTIYNLTRDTDYNVRIVLKTKDDYSYEGSHVKYMPIKTTCAGITENDISIIPSERSARVTIRYSRETCDCAKFIISINLQAPFYICPGSDYIINYLQPFMDYNLTITRVDNNEAIIKTFKTTEGAPGKVRDLNIVASNETAVTLSWLPPIEENGIIRHYKITYKHIKYLGCYHKKNNAESEGGIETPSTTETLMGLISFSEYEVRVHAVTLFNGDFAGLVVNTNPTVIPTVNEIPIVNITQDRAVLIVKLTISDCIYRMGTIFYNVHLNCEYEWCENIERTENGAKKVTSLSYNIVGSSKYSILINVIRDRDNALAGRNTTTVHTTSPTAPNIVRDVVAYSISKDAIYLRWNRPYPPTGELVEYNVKFCWWNSGWRSGQVCDNVNVLPSSCKIWTSLDCCEIPNLMPKKQYNIKVSAKNKIPDSYGGFSEAINVETVIRKSQPPQNASVLWDEFYNLTVSWFHPDVTNGNLEKFQIGILSPKGSSSHSYPIKLTNLTYNFTVDCSRFTATDLEIQIYALNDAGHSSYVSSKTMSPPKRPKLLDEPNVLESNNHSILIDIPTPTEIEGNSTMYIIMTDNVIPSGSERKFNAVWNEGIIDVNHLSWIAAEIPLTSYQESRRKFLIGNDTKTYSKRLEYEILNSVLNSGTNYTATILLRNTFAGFSRSMVYKLPCSTSGMDGIKDASNSWHTILIIVAVLILLAVVGLMLFLKRNSIYARRPVRSIMTGMRNLGNRPSPDIVPLAQTTSSSSRNKPPLKVKAKLVVDVKRTPSKKEDDSKFTNPVNISDFEAYVKEAINSGELERQHALFPRGQTKPWTYGTKPQNKSKNRYSNLAAYDHTRVKLEFINNDPSSDYINANYIEGYNAPNAYIATQGPKVATLNDFWRMIWQERVEYIIMLANIFEAGKKKVEKYWPEINETLAFGKITVQYLSVDVFADYELRVFHVYCDGEDRKVKQLHFLSWPDHGVPLYAQSLVPFLRRMLTIPHGTAPVVVHCSAGVGRTGTIILCDICLRMAAREGQVDVLHNQFKIREQRANMVDNIEQYKLVHLVLLQCLVAPETNISCTEDMELVVEKLLNSDALDFQMKYLDDTAWQDHSMEAVASEEISPIFHEKNRFEHIIPNPSSRIFLVRFPVSDDSSSYINAVKVDGFQAPSKFIVTQLPLPNTVGDFWRLVDENELSVIVSLNTIDLKEKTSCHFWPTEASPELHPVPFLTVKYVDNLSDPYFDIVTLQVENNGDKKKEFLVRIIDLKGWDSNDACPSNPHGLLAAYEEMNRLGRRSDSILVVCYDGVKASGLFVSLCFVVDKIKLEQLCDVSLAVRTVRHSRNEFVRDREQFAFLYKAAVEYINSFETYSNFVSGNK